MFSLFAIENGLLIHSATYFLQQQQQQQQQELQKIIAN